VGETFAGYTIVRLIGSGGMGEVYLARHPRLPREDALKVLRPDVSSDQEFRQRFIREADLASALKHPNIVTVHDRGEFEGQLWIATEYVEGTDAAQLMAARYPVGMPVEEAAAIITPIADALDYAHGRGLLHRDVKPANILLGQPDHAGQRRVFLADFGIARPMADPNGLTATNLTLGTVAYAAPEQLMGEPLDGRADEYALAATAFNLLTGGPMYEASNPVAVISKHLNTPAPAVSSRRSDLIYLDGAFTTALAKNPGDRFPTCNQFASAVSDRAGLGSISGNTTQYGIVPPSPAKPRRKILRPALFTAAALVLVGALAAVVINVTGHGKQSGIASPTLNGTYRFVYDYTKGTNNGAPIPPGVPSTTPIVYAWAYRSVCASSGCVATGTKLDSANPNNAASPPLTSVLRFVQGHWQETFTPDYSQVDESTCLGVDGTVVQGTETRFTTRAFEAQPDGTLRGMQTSTVLTNECGFQGVVIQTPVTATRTADIPTGIILANPANLPPAPPPMSIPALPAGSPVLDGAYRIEYDSPNATVNGNRVRPTPATYYWIAFRSLCTATRCVATAVELDDNNHQGPVAGRGLNLFQFTDGHWQTTPYIMGPEYCPADKQADTRTLSVSLEPQPDGTLHGTETATILTNQCGRQGNVYETPVIATRIGDVPPAVVLADPALFM